MSEEEKRTLEEPDEEMTVTIETDDGQSVECSVITIFEAMGRDYIALLPEAPEGDDEEETDVWFYRFSENPDDPNEEPVLDDIESDEEFEAVLDAFDQFLDDVEFEEM
ncbi:MAG: DUF1292 domain-containing protein [Lachnospiraceae bacterium]|nr:DUF1292 domain-containing protein [Lachnospiraceae bacterium]